MCLLTRIPNCRIKRRPTDRKSQALESQPIRTTVTFLPLLAAISKLSQYLIIALALLLPCPPSYWAAMLIPPVLTVYPYYLTTFNYYVSEQIVFARTNGFGIP
jgi:hypothetical protein